MVTKTTNTSAQPQMPERPIVITSGEPAGIGPDIILQLAQAWQRRDGDASLFNQQLIIIGSATVFEQRAAELGISLRLILVDAQTLDTKSTSPNNIETDATLYMIDVAIDVAVTAGQLDTAHAQHLLKMLDCAIDGCVNKTFSAMVTAPLSKQVINDAGIAFTGHTEYLAERTNTEQVVMLLASDTLRVTLATTHIPLRAVADALSIEGLVQILSIIHHDLHEKFGIAHPVIHVCGLNPHAGEGGHLGTEEQTIITPAIAKAKALGIDARGPFSADTAFTVSPRPDAFLAMFHDQGLPVLKYASFGHAVNITLGLPIIRTSVDHGTALTLAGTGKADTGSLEAAIDAAIMMVNAQNSALDKSSSENNCEKQESANG